MTIHVDARGFSCPQPVMMTQKAINTGVFPIEVLVDTMTSCENVRRLSEKLGYQVDVQIMKDEFKLVLTK